MKSILCFFGFHEWEASATESVKLSGFNILFFTWGTQKGKKVCSRCGKEKLCHRSGFVGADNPEWVDD